MSIPPNPDSVSETPKNYTLHDIFPYSIEQSSNSRLANSEVHPTQDVEPIEPIDNKEVEVLSEANAATSLSERTINTLQDIVQRKVSSSVKDFFKILIEFVKKLVTSNSGSLGDKWDESKLTVAYNKANNKEKKIICKEIIDNLSKFDKESQKKLSIFVSGNMLTNWNENQVLNVLNHTNTSGKIIMLKEILKSSSGFTSQQKSTLVGSIFDSMLANWDGNQVLGAINSMDVNDRTIIWKQIICVLHEFNGKEQKDLSNIVISNVLANQDENQILNILDNKNNENNKQIIWREIIDNLSGFDNKQQQTLTNFVFKSALTNSELINSLENNDIEERAKVWKEIINNPSNFDNEPQQKLIYLVAKDMIANWDEEKILGTLNNASDGYKATIRNGIANNLINFDIESQQMLTNLVFKSVLADQEKNDLIKSVGSEQIEDKTKIWEGVMNVSSNELQQKLTYLVAKDMIANWDKCQNKIPTFLRKTSIEGRKIIWREIINNFANFTTEQQKNLTNLVFKSVLSNRELLTGLEKNKLDQCLSNTNVDNRATIWKGVMKVSSSFDNELQQRLQYLVTKDMLAYKASNPTKSNEVKDVAWELGLISQLKLAEEHPELYDAIQNPKKVQISWNRSDIHLPRDNDENTEAVANLTTEDIFDFEKNPKAFETFFGAFQQTFLYREGVGTFANMPPIELGNETWIYDENSTEEERTKDLLRKFLNLCSGDRKKAAEFFKNFIRQKYTFSSCMGNFGSFFQRDFEKNLGASNEEALFLRNTFQCSADRGFLKVGNEGNIYYCAQRIKAGAPKKEEEAIEQNLNLFGENFSPDRIKELLQADPLSPNSFSILVHMTKIPFGDGEKEVSNTFCIIGEAQNPLPEINLDENNASS